MEIWEEPQPGESSIAWAAFTHYRDLGSSRTVDLAWRRSTGRSKGKANSRWGQWSSANHWVERSKAYDAHLDTIVRETREKRFVELINRQADKEHAVQDSMEELERWQRGNVEKQNSLPAADIERIEDKEVTASETGLITVRSVTTRVKGMKTASYARMCQDYKNTMKLTVVSVHNRSEEVKRSSTGTRKTPLPEFMRQGLEDARALKKVAHSDASRGT